MAWARSIRRARRAGGVSSDRREVLREDPRGLGAHRGRREDRLVAARAVLVRGLRERAHVLAVAAGELAAVAGERGRCEEGECGDQDETAHGDSFRWRGVTTGLA